MSSAPGASGPAAARGALRWLRGSVVGVVATLLAATGHAYGGGVVPGPAHLALVGGAAVLVSVALSGRRWGLTSLVAVLGGLQVVVHVAFSTGADVVSVTSTATSHGMAMPTMSGMDAHAMPGPTMALGHLAAALLTALLLRRGEDWCWALADLLTRPLRALAWTPAPAPTGRPGVPTPRATPAPRLLLLARSVSRRGPPALLPA